MDYATLTDNELTVVRFHNHEALVLFDRITKLRNLDGRTRQIAERALWEAQAVAQEMTAEMHRRGAAIAEF